MTHDVNPADAEQPAANCRPAVELNSGLNGAAHRWSGERASVSVDDEHQFRRRRTLVSVMPNSRVGTAELALGVTNPSGL
jgi:hypothetical protein